MAFPLPSDKFVPTDHLLGPRPISFPLASPSSLSLVTPFSAVADRSLGPIPMSFPTASPSSSGLSTSYSTVGDRCNWNDHGNGLAEPQRRKRQEQRASAPEITPPMTPKMPRIPSRREIREWKVAATKPQRLHRLPSASNSGREIPRTKASLSGNGSGDNGDVASNISMTVCTPLRPHSTTPASLSQTAVVAHQFSVLSQSLASTAADISGISLALADYLAWVRKHHPALESTLEHVRSHQGGHQMQLNSLFETFEARAREIAGMATGRIAGALERAAMETRSVDDGGPEFKWTEGGEGEALVAQAVGDRAGWFEDVYEIGNWWEAQRLE